MLNVPLYAIVVENNLKLTKNNKDYLQLTLRTPHGVIKAMMWDIPANALVSPLYPQKDDFIRVDDFLDQLADKKSIVLRLPITKLNKDENLELYSSIINSGGQATPEELQEAIKTIFDPTLFENETIYNFIINCFNVHGTEKLKQCPAATNNHHAYSGGLLVHTKEVLLTCKSMCEIYKNKYNYINSDVLYCAAILHDIGKLETYLINNDGLAESLYTEKTLGHIYLGMSLVQKTFYSLPQEVRDKIGGTRFLEEVLHCISAHHGKVEYGSIKEIQSIEAQILSSADLISSKFGMLDKTVRELSNELKAGETIRLHSDVFYFNSIGIEKGRK
jgi:3'-5' exoribonuclease